MLAELGGAPRSLLATYLALFEDSTIQRRINERVEVLMGRGQGDRMKVAPVDSLGSLQRKTHQWEASKATDNALRMILWGRLREGLRLGPMTFGSVRSTRTAAEDLVAAALKLLEPGLVESAAERCSQVGAAIAKGATTLGRALGSLFPKR